MKITVLCSDPGHAVVPHLRRWEAGTRAAGHDVSLIHDAKELTGGDVLFLVSCSQIIAQEELARYRAALVLHAADLPKRRGWSPHVWAVVEGESRITVCLLTASDPVDTGAVWLRRSFMLEGHELLPEINAKLFSTELQLMSELLQRWGQIEPQPQRGDPGPYMKRRTPEHSRLDPYRTIAEQFDLLRVVDSERYPAFIDFRGERYVIRIEKVAGDEPR
jgi:methionyl-tRNA formyltransferase